MAMSIESMLAYNKKFVAENQGAKYHTTKYPDKKVAIVTCMDTRLVELLPAALGIKNGDVKMIKNAGGCIDDPFGEAMRSILVGVYELGVEHIMIIGHTNCGVQGMNAEEMEHLMVERGIPAERIELIKNCGIDLESWLTGFTVLGEAVAKSVELVRNHPLLPIGIDVTGYIIDTETGELTPID